MAMKSSYPTPWDTILRAHLGHSNDREFIPHMLRHTCASRLVSRGVPLPKVMQWMGHKCIQTTLRYSHLVPNDLDEAAAILEHWSERDAKEGWTEPGRVGS